MPIAAWFSNAGKWLRWLITFAAGGISALSMAPVFAWPVMFLTLPALVLLLDHDASKRETWPSRASLVAAAKTGWFFGFGYFLAGLFWIGEAFLVEPDKFLWALPLAVAGVPAALAIFYAVACALAMLVWRPGSWRILTLACAFFTVEWIRGHVLTGFPWNSLGYALVGNEALLQSASLFGAYGLTFVAVFIFASPAAIFDLESGAAKRWAAPAIAAIALIGMGVWGAARLADASSATLPGVKMRIVQGNIPQAEKWRPENRAWIFERYLRLSSENVPPDLTHVIWPESSTPFLFAADDAIFDELAREAIKSAIPQGGSLILGAERATTSTDANGKRSMTGVYNTLFVLSGDAKIEARYDKNHLVPFGEYLPFPGFFKWLGAKHLTHHAIGFEAGTSRNAIQTRHAPPFSPLICYEIIFPGAVMPDAGARWMLNLTNDAWFGATSGPHQHLLQARVRAAEEGRPVVRAANTGISAVIDSYGRVTKSLPLNSEGVIDVSLPSTVIDTEYSQISEWGFVPLFLLILMLFLTPLTVARINKT
ncbi:MAG: apolipoprotein N-acyltransferase [Hyphomicrobiales bacterium]|nr:apolipoprotein N-acyltransferase [Hyphomicrobiales bacterium]